MHWFFFLLLFTIKSILSYVPKRCMHLTRLRWMDTGIWTSLPKRVEFKAADCAWHFGRSIKRGSCEGIVGG